MRKKTVEDINLAGKRVFLRVDFNVPMDMSGVISDDSRIKACLPTIEYLIDHNARVIICSHLGRPDGKVVENLRLTPVAKRLSELLGKPVSQEHVPRPMGYHQWYPGFLSYKRARCSTPPVEDYFVCLLGSIRITPY